jgi:gamma-D-glutamyl-L-lysine dipeptidyl-peptidase
MTAKDEIRVSAGHIAARAALVPLQAEPSLRAEQVSQLVLGETAAVQEASGEWRRVRCDLDGYLGWVHTGYLIELAPDAAAAWHTDAAGWSLGAVARIGADLVRLPLRARVAVGRQGVRLPDGRVAALAAGEVPTAAEVCRKAAALPPERWAMERFAGAPYLWGGVTPWGVDCSGLVQTTFAARGVLLPRDAALQVEHGVPVAAEDIRPGDLLFFRGESTERITHVAFAAEGDGLIHSTLPCGGMVAESWRAGTRAAPLRERLVAVRRMETR